MNHAGLVVMTDKVKNPTDP